MYNNILNRLECYWRYVDDVEDKVIIYRRCTLDGINWTNKEIACMSDSREKKDYVSPAILFENGVYKIWYVDKNNVTVYATSVNGLNWKDQQTINLNYEDKTKTWHLDVIHTQKGYEMLIVAYKNWNLRNDMNLYYTFSKDGLNWDVAKVILEPAKKTTYWDNKGIYRSSLIYEEGKYFVFYGGTAKDYSHGIGFVYGEDINNLKKVNTNFKKQKEVENLKNKIKM